MIDAAIGAYTASENALSSEVLDRLTPGMLCLADRGFYSHGAWQRASAAGADLLWRVKSNLKVDPVQDLPAGSWIAEVFDSADRKRTRSTTVRVIEYTIDGGREPTGPYRLITTILDPDQAPAAELARAHTQRWEIEAAEHGRRDPDRVSFVTALRISRRSSPQRGACYP